MDNIEWNDNKREKGNARLSPAERAVPFSFDSSASRIARSIREPRPRGNDFCASLVDLMGVDLLRKNDGVHTLEITYWSTRARSTHASRFSRQRAFSAADSIAARPDWVSLFFPPNRQVDPTRAHDSRKDPSIAIKCAYDCANLASQASRCTHVRFARESREKSGEKSVGTPRSDDVCYLLLFCHETVGAE